MPLSGLRISAVADRVVVREGDSRWQAESGQYLLGFDGNPEDGFLSVIEHEAPAAAANDARQWFEQGIAQERDDVEGALQAYARAIAADPAFLDARINMGRLLHDRKRFAEAERVYREALKAGAGDPLLCFNLGVLYDDMGRAPEAKQAYEAALRADPDLADCHYNLALLFEKLAQPKEAIRHMARYRVLVGTRPK